MAQSNGTIPPADTGKKTLIEEGTEFKGSLASKCPIVVRGRIEGELNAPSLMVSASGSVQGKVKVGDMRSEGEIAGEFEADTVHVSGTVRDNTVIRAKSLEVKLAPANGKMQVIFGECSLDIGDQPTDQPAATPSLVPHAPEQVAAPPAPTPTAKNERKNGRGKGGPIEERETTIPSDIPPPPGE